MTILRDAYTPTGNLALMNNFYKLTDLEMGPDKSLATYMSRIGTTICLLRGEKFHLHGILVNLFPVKGLGSAYKDVKGELDLCIKKLTTLTLKKLERKCDTLKTPRGMFSRTTPSLRHQ